MARELPRLGRAEGDTLYLADYDGPMVTDGVGPARPLGAKRGPSYRWAGVVPTPAALYVAQTGDFVEGLMRIALPAGGEEPVVWIGGANDNAGLQGPLLFGDQLVWGAGGGIYRTDLATRATVRLSSAEGPLAGDGAQTICWSVLRDRKVYRAVLPP